MTLSKVELISNVLSLNYSLFWVDTDVVFFASPFHYLEELEVNNTRMPLSADVLPAGS